MSPCSTRNAHAARRFPCSSSSAARASSRSCGRAVHAAPQRARCSARRGPGARRGAAQLGASCSAAYARMVSSIARRCRPDSTGRSRTRLLSTRAPVPSTHVDLVRGSLRRYGLDVGQSRADEDREQLEHPCWPWSRRSTLHSIVLSRPGLPRRKVAPPALQLVEPSSRRDRSSSTAKSAGAQRRARSRAATRRADGRSARRRPRCRL